MRLNYSGFALNHPLVAGGGNVVVGLAKTASHADHLHQVPAWPNDALVKGWDGVVRNGTGGQYWAGTCSLCRNPLEPEDDLRLALDEDGRGLYWHHALCAERAGAAPSLTAEQMEQERLRVVRELGEMSRLLAG